MKTVMKYRKKPIVIEAIQYGIENKESVIRFLGKSFFDINTMNFSIQIITLEGIMTASIGDYIIKGVSGELYPCKPDIFVKTYDLVEGEFKIE